MKVHVESERKARAAELTSALEIHVSKVTHGDSENFAEFFEFSDKSEELKK